MPSHSRGSLPSELLTLRPLDELQKKKDIAEWQPGLDCMIPLMNMQRPNLPNYILADFKWDVSSPGFRGRESILREIYLGMAVEIFMADIVARRGALPGKPVNFTFTYPLRTRSSELNEFKKTLGRVMDNASRSLGCTLALRNGTGTYNESRAAKGGTGTVGEVSLVGDLGGGTLDLFISANTLEGVTFEEVADSAKLGGNQLLKALAKNPQQFLPVNAGWTQDASGCETQLRAWMRSKGSADLFGAGVGDDIKDDGLGVRSFNKPAQTVPARQLINRYFRLIAEYMARSLAAFLARHWYTQMPPAHHQKLKVLVQFRGNGWRLWPDAVDYKEIEKEIGGWVEKRVQVLWADPSLHGQTGELALPAGPWSARDTGDVNPKTAPILEAVGKAESDEDAERFYSHTLVALDLVHAEQPTLPPVPWFSRIPFRTGGKATKIQLTRIEPPLPLSHEIADVVVDDLEEQRKLEINRKLLEEGVPMSDVNFKAPVAPIVWEAVFKSSRLSKG